MGLLDDPRLERSDIVANSRMNRERGLEGGNGYAKDLGFNPVEVLSELLAEGEPASWLDLCCGSGKALVEAAARLERAGLSRRVTIVGVDLVGMFVPAPHACVRLEEASVLRWRPKGAFDLITCVHGLHYVGDKLRVLANAAAWLSERGRFVANFDARSIKIAGAPSGKVVTALRAEGFQYNPRTRRVSRTGGANVRFPFRWLGADDTAGPNYTGQPAVDAHYA